MCNVKCEALHIALSFVAGGVQGVPGEGSLYAD